MPLDQPVRYRYKKGTNIRLADKLLLSYLAGFLDGEGCIMLPVVTGEDRRNGNRLVIVVDNTNDLSLHLFAIRFGGSVIRIKPSRHNQRGYFRWTVTDRRAEYVIRELLPYLRLKQPQAKVALLFRDTVGPRYGCRGLPESVLNKRAPLVAKIRLLNAKGPEVPLRCQSDQAAIGL